MTCRSLRRRTTSFSHKRPQVGWTVRNDTVGSNIGELLKPLSIADVFARPASSVARGVLRLDAGFYGSGGYRSLRAMEDSGFRIGRVREVATVRWLGPFARDYVDDPRSGVPF